MSTLRPFLSAEWRHLLMLNYAIDPAVLAPYVPRGTELDIWNGTAYVSIVGLLFLNTKVLGMGIPFHRNFEEVNLRFYVRRKAEDGWRRGVVFIKEIVPRRAVAATARLTYGERYIAVPMRHRVELEHGTIRSGSQVEYTFRYGSRWNRLAARADGNCAPAALGSEEEFITEHYWGYTAHRRGRCAEYRVEHPSWQIWNATEVCFECNVADIYGREFVPYLQEEPRSALVADGSPVIVYRGVDIS